MTVLAAGLARCIRRHALSARKNAKFLLSQAATVQSIARIAIPSAKTAAVN